MDINQSLATTKGNVVSVIDNDWDGREHSRQLFSSLRRIFSSKRQLDRAVFWIEERHGQLIVRHVRNLARRKKSEDLVVAQTIPDVDAALVSIGNFASGCYLTQVRWELYADFDLRQSLRMGRFDQRDMLGSIDESKARGLAARNIFPSGNWDFDALIDLHRCPMCQKMFNSDQTIFVSTGTCESCGKVANPHIMSSFVQTLLMREALTIRTLVVHPTQEQERQSNFPIQHFVDPLANTISLWLIEAFGELGSVYDKDRTMSQYTPQFCRIFDRSIFRVLQIEYLRDKLLAHLDGLGEHDWALLLGVASQLGRLLQGTLEEDLVETFQKDEGRNRQFIRELLPGFINTAIVACAEHEEGEGNGSRT